MSEPLDLIEALAKVGACGSGLEWLRERREYDARRGKRSTFAERWKQAVAAVPDWAGWAAETAGMPRPKLGRGAPRWCCWGCASRKQIGKLDPLKVERALFRACTRPR